MEILNLIKGKKVIILLNKIDLNSKIDENDSRLLDVSRDIIKVSALNNLGIDKLYEKITDMFNLDQINLDNEVLITNLRQKNLITKAIEHIQETKNTMSNNMPLDIVAISIKEILEDLGSITGDEVSEDIIDEIFSKFCLGK